tara:strand:- start:720 stop:1865 length:1146 start_codon:yes stop_codon:yes gene_type:complete
MPNIGLCLTDNISLKNWKKSGHLSRELIYIKRFLNKGNKFNIITYGDSSDVSIKLPYSINIFPLYIKIKKTNNKFFNYALHFLRVFTFFENLRKIDLIKSNQLIGSNITILIGLVFRKKVIIRIGYEPGLTLKYESLLAKKSKKFNFRKLLFYKIYLLGLISYKLSDHIICTSKEQKLYIKKNFLVNPKKISIIPNWIDTNLFSPNLKSFNKEGILYVGRFEREKNLETLLESMRGIDEKIIMIGSGSLTKELKILSKKLFINLEIINRLPNIELVSYYQKCKIYVQPSHYEGNPKTILEAMSCGCSVIVKDVPGVREVVNKNNGILIKDDSKLNDAMKLLLKNDNKRNMLGKNARKHIKSHNNIDICFSKEQKIISKLLS